MIRAKRILVFVLIALATRAFAATPEGTYSNVCLYPDTGHQGGIELQLRSIDGKPSVTLKTCEGGCWQMPTTEVKIAGDRITFVATDQDFYPNGALARSTDHRFVGTIRKNSIVIDSPGFYGTQQLARQHYLTGSPYPVSGSKSSEWPGPTRRCR